MILVPIVVLIGTGVVFNKVLDNEINKMAVRMIDSLFQTERP